MARFDVHLDRSTGALVVDCQADYLDSLETRIVAPLSPAAGSRVPIKRLQPIVPYAGEPHILFVDLLAATPVWDLGPALASLADHNYEIVSALDFLTTGV